MTTTAIPNCPEKRWEWIKYSLRTLGTSLADLARRQEVSRNAVLNVKRVPYPRMERAIASALGMQPEQIWPERWGSFQAPYRQRPNRAEFNSTKNANPTTQATTSHPKVKDKF